MRHWQGCLMSQAFLGVSRYSCVKLHHMLERFPNYSWTSGTTFDFVCLPEVVILWIVTSFISDQLLLQSCTAGRLARQMCFSLFDLQTAFFSQHFFLD